MTQDDVKYWLNQGVAQKRADIAKTDLREAVEAFLEAQDALDNHEVNGQNGADYFTLLRLRNAARRDLDAVMSMQGLPVPSKEVA